MIVDYLFHRKLNDNKTDLVIIEEDDHYITKREDGKYAIIGTDVTVYYENVHDSIYKAFICENTIEKELGLIHKMDNDIWSAMTKNGSVKSNSVITVIESLVGETMNI